MYLYRLYVFTCCKGAKQMDRYMLPLHPQFKEPTKGTDKGSQGAEQHVHTYRTNKTNDPICAHGNVAERLHAHTNERPNDYAHTRKRANKFLSEQFYMRTRENKRTNLLTNKLLSDYEEFFEQTKLDE